MAQFSERIGAKKPDEVLQIDSMNENLRNSLWNLLLDIYSIRHPTESDFYWKQVAKYIAKDFLKVPADDLLILGFPNNWVKDRFMELHWYRVYDLLEFLVNNHEKITTCYEERRINAYYPIHYHPNKKGKIIKSINLVLKSELSGYRFIEGVLVPIIDPAETKEIESLIKKSSQLGFHGVRQHIKTAVELFGKKPEPDYRNTIKEAISAVESLAKQITGNRKSTLDNALKELESKVSIHKALRSSFSSLYGYTSDESGIRHAILDEPTVGFDEAKYMIVACSAFINYLISKADSAGLLDKANKL